VRKSLAFNAAMILSLLACFALIPAGGSAQTWVDLSKKLIDDCARFNQGVDDMTLTMEMQVPSSEGTVKTQSVLYRKGERFRAEMTMEGMEDAGLPAGMGDMKTMVINDGTNVWIIAPMMGKSQVPSDEGAKYRGQWTCSDYIPVDAEIIGSEKVGGRDCYVLAVLDKSSDFAKLWIDRKNYALLKIEGKKTDDETMVVLFSDFRKVPGGIEMAYKAEMYSDKDLISTVIMKSVEINTGLADDLFDADNVKAEGTDVPDFMEKVKEKVGKVLDE